MTIEKVVVEAAWRSRSCSGRVLKRWTFEADVQKGRELDVPIPTIAGRACKISDRFRNTNHNL